MLNRHIDSVIAQHFSSSKKALLLTGARQTGKTYAIRRYAREAGLQLVEMNFVLNPRRRTYRTVRLMCKKCCCVYLPTPSNR